MCLLKTCVVATAIGMQPSFKISSTSESLSVSFRKCYMGFIQRLSLENEEDVHFLSLACFRKVAKKC